MYRYSKHVQTWVKKDMIKILQGSAVTQTVLGGLTIHPQIPNFLYSVCAKKLPQLVGSRQSYYNSKKQAYVFGPPSI